MFHDGDLQSGISRAISEGKLVACFVRQEGDEDSRIWEEDWLGNKQHPAKESDWNGTLGEFYATKAVILRIEYGSKEASFLNAFCPISKAPAFVIIHNGQVLDKVEGGVDSQEFHEKISRALGFDTRISSRPNQHGAQGGQSRREAAGATPSHTADSDTLEGAQASQAAHSEPIEQVSPQHEVPETSQAPSSSNFARPTSSNTAQQESSNMSSLFPDRAQRLEVEKAKRDAAEKAEKAARASARKKEAEEAHAMHRPDKGKDKEPSDAAEKEKSRRDWLVQQKQRKDEAKKERERILAQIEADKQERKARSQRAPETVIQPLPPSTDAASKRRMGAGGVCSLSIRLFDGSSIKGRFEPSTTVATGVRDWIKQNAAGEGAADVPFTFKQILAPLPSRSIEISEEHQSLQELGLTPNATLVLVPVSGYTEAYSGGGQGRGYMSSALHATYGVVNTAAGLVSSVISHIPGLGGRSGNSSETASISTQETVQRRSTDSGSSSIKVRSLADQRAEAAKKADQQTEFYNGNSSAFEGRKDDQDEQK